MVPDSQKDTFNSNSMDHSGQFVAPNPIEIFWEKNKRYIVSILLLFGLYLIGYYSVKFYNRSLRNSRWNLVNSKLLLKPLYLPPRNPSFENFGFVYKFSLGKKPIVTLQALKKELDYTAYGWASLFVAEAYSFVGESKGVISSLDKLSDLNLPVFFKANSISWPDLKFHLTGSDPGNKPIIWNNKFLNINAPKVIKGNSNQNFLFRKEHSNLFVAPIPDKKTLVVFETSIGVFKVGLFVKKAPLYSENFLKKVSSKFYDGLRFFKIQHQAPIDPRFGFSLPSGGDIAWVGNPTTRKENRKLWDLHYQSKETLPFQSSGISHFPFVLAAERVPDSLESSSEIVYFTASDCSKERDGGNVVFGYVVEGKEIIKTIIGGKLSTPSEEKSGKGVPKKPVKIIKAYVGS